jgi:cyclopropane-fatty-acyl-phospholipid synthase
MWPNSCLPSATALVTAANRASRGRFTLERVENHAAHYPRTLREWGRRLETRLTPAALGLNVSQGAPAVAVPASSELEKLGALFIAEKQGSTPVASGPTAVQVEETLLRRLPKMHVDDQMTDLAALDFQAIKRKWQYLFAYAAAGFAKGYITCAFFLVFRVP